MRLRGIFVQKNLRLQHFQSPRWWTGPFGYLSFLPVIPSFTGYPFDRLDHVPPLDQSEEGFRLNPTVADSWRRLERVLIRAIATLASKYPVGVLLPFYPVQWGYLEIYPNHSVAKARAHIARDWFVIFMAGLSFLVAVGSRCPQAGPSVPDWFMTLANAGCAQSWLTGVAASPICEFSPFVSRVGLFLNLLDREKTQPDVEWFYNFHIPLWYPWGKAEADAARSRPSLNRWAPPAYKLQEATTFITQQPSAPRAPPGKSPSTRPAWEEFFAERERSNALRREKETPQQREKRLNRERKPPTVSAQVFEWVESDSDLSQLVRKAVVSREREDTLAFYGAQQCRYDSFRNEWDCCEHFGPGTDIEDEYEDDYMQGPEQQEAIDPLLEYNPPDPSNTRPSHPVTTLVNELPPLDAVPEAYEVVEILHLHYGFLPPIPPPALTKPIDPKDVQTLLRALGWGRNRAYDPVFDTGLGQVVFDFCKTLTSNNQPDPSLWDLSRNNRQPLSLSNRIAHLRHLPSGVLLFDFEQAATVPWKVSVSRPVSALFICRLDPAYNDVDIARALLERGIPFRTLLPLRPITPSPSRSSPSPPIRLPGYKFTKDDYVAYLHQRAVILHGCRGRAALLRGGILWRLAVQETSFDTVLGGPSSAVLVHRHGFSIQGHQSGDELWDDDLSENDVFAICGAYKCYTGTLYSTKLYYTDTWFPGIKDQTAIVSWYPLPSTFDNSGLCYDRWNESADVEFNQWVAAIKGGGQPLPQHRWRDKIRSSGKARELKASAMSSAIRFLNHHARGDGGF